MVPVVVPDLGEGITDATVSFWFHEEGDLVTEGTDLVEMATDKATFTIPAAATGVLREVFFEEGESVGVGEVLAHIEQEE